MDAVEFLKTRERICSQFNACSGCDFDDGSFNCPLDNGNDPENAVKIAEKWAKEHPRKTNLDKIREMFPEMIAVSNMGENDSVEMLIFYKEYLDREYKEKESETAGWIREFSNDCILPSFRCSKCNKTATFFSAYCPHCGIKMNGFKEKEDVDC